MKEYSEINNPFEDLALDYLDDMSMLSDFIMGQPLNV